LANKEILLNFRIDNKQAEELAYVEKHLPHHDRSMKLRYILRMGCQTCFLLVGEQAKFDYGLKTFIDELNPRRKAELIELLISELGEKEIQFLRANWAKRAARKQMDAQTTNTSSPDAKTILLTHSDDRAYSEA